MEAVGRTGVLAQRAADVSWVTRRALEIVSLLAELEDVRNTFLNFDRKPANGANTNWWCADRASNSAWHCGRWT